MTTTRAERRRSWQSFRDTLARIAERVDNRCVLQAQWTDRLLHRGKMTSQIRVRALWVAGSFARGSATCGDLDVIGDVVVEEGEQPGERAIARAVLGRAPDVRLYVGTPEENSSRIEFPEARLVWSDVQRDWPTALGNIKCDPAGARFKRKSDELPFRADQLEVEDPASLERFLDLQEKGVISWEFVASSEIETDEKAWPVDAREWFHRMSHSTGKKTVDVLRHVVSLVRARDPWIPWDTRNHDGCTFRLGGAEIRIGRPRIDLDCLDGLACSALHVAPHKSRRGPNGLWILQRGPSHPLERLFVDTGAYYLRADSRGPVVIRWQIHPRLDAMTIQLFPTRDAANAQARENREAFGVDHESEVARATGSELLRLISVADVIELGDLVLPLTRLGTLVIEDGDVAETTPEQLIHELGGAGGGV